MEKFFWKLARRGLLRRKQHILQDRLKFRYFIGWQRALYYQFKLVHFERTRARALKEEAFSHFQHNLSHIRWAKKTIQRRARAGLVRGSFVR